MSDAADDPPFPDDAVEVARVLDAWGIKGGLKIQAYAGDPQAIFSSKRWFLKPALPRPGAAVAAVPAGPVDVPHLLRVIQARRQGDGVVATVQGVTDRNAAEALKGARIFVPRASFPTASMDEYYWVDLIGLAVVNRQGEALGTVTELFNTGAHSVLRLRAEPVQPGDAQPATADAVHAERMIPFVAAYIDSVDLAARRIVADWGLDY